MVLDSLVECGVNSEPCGEVKKPHKYRRGMWECGSAGGQGCRDELWGDVCEGKGGGARLCCSTEQIVWSSRLRVCYIGNDVNYVSDWREEHCERDEKVEDGGLWCGKNIRSHKRKVNNSGEICSPSPKR